MKLGRFRIAVYVMCLVLIGVVYVVSKNISYRLVTIETKGPVVNLIKGTDKKIITTISDKMTVQLEDGYYCVSTNDVNYASDSSCFTVYKKDTTFVYNPEYSSDYLTSLLKKEINSINTVINTSYSSIISDYVVCEGSLYGLGDIYGTVLYKKPARQNDSIDIYKVILHKNNSVWTIVNRPVIVLDSVSFSDIPLSVLKAVNTQQACSPPETPSDYSQLSVPTNTEPQLPIEQQGRD